VPALALDLATRLGGVSLLHPRYATVALPAVALGHAFLLGAAPRRPAWMRPALLAAYAAVVLLVRLAPHAAVEGTFSDRFTDQRWDLAVPALARDHRPGDLVLYRTQYVELDAVVAGEASPEIVGFVEWPLLAHLPPGLEIERRPLPFGKTLDDRRRLEPILEEALRSGAPRIWIVGHPPLIQPLVRAAERTPGVRVERRERYGQVLLVLLARGAP
jgi:hypothetical protein